MKKNRIASFVLTAVLLAAAPLRATTVIPPTFDELVGQAEVIFQGTVTEVKSQWIGEGGQRHIVTYVSLQVEDAIKGEPGESFTMRMLGGTVDGTTMEVSDAPKFKVGQREILFVEHNGTQFIPLVGIMHGRFHVTKDSETGTEKVLADNGEALTDLAKLGKGDVNEPDKSRSTSDALSAANALDKDSFKSAIRAKLGPAR